MSNGQERIFVVAIVGTLAQQSMRTRKGFLVLQEFDWYARNIQQTFPTAGPDKFEQKDAILLQNKDEVLIPLLTNVLPTAKEFKDAVVSLSPEQRAFAEAFRAMQLEPSVFGVCVIQLMPQLERLLELPKGALTKDIQLTQDLMSLFVDYQIPSDLLSFDGAADADVLSKVNEVKDCVKSVMDGIESSKEKQLIEEERKADMRGELICYATEHLELLGGESESSPGVEKRRRKVMARRMTVASPAFAAEGMAPSRDGSEKECLLGRRERRCAESGRRHLRLQLFSSSINKYAGQVKEFHGSLDVSLPVTATLAEEHFTLR
jgi:hypothetical protein